MKKLYVPFHIGSFRQQISSRKAINWLYHRWRQVCVDTGSNFWKENQENCQVPDADMNDHLESGIANLLIKAYTKLQSIGMNIIHDYVISNWPLKKH